MKPKDNADKLVDFKHLSLLTNVKDVFRDLVKSPNWIP